MKENDPTTDTNYEAQEGQEPRLARNGLLQATVTMLLWKKWWVDNESPYHERWLFFDGISLDEIGQPFYSQAWWAIPLENLKQFDELDRIPVGSILAMTSAHCRVDSGLDFLSVHNEGPFPEDSPQLSLSMKAPEVTVLAPENFDSDLLASLHQAQEAHFPPAWGESRPVQSPEQG